MWACTYEVDRWMPAKLVGRLTVTFVNHLIAKLMNRLPAKLVDRLTAMLVVVSFAIAKELSFPNDSFNQIIGLTTSTGIKV